MSTRWELFNLPEGVEMFVNSKLILTGHIQLARTNHSLYVEFSPLCNVLKVVLFIGGVLVDNEQVSFMSADDEAKVELSHYSHVAKPLLVEDPTKLILRFSFVYTAVADRAL